MLAVLKRLHLISRFSKAKNKEAEAKIKSLFGDCQPTNKQTRLAIDKARLQRSRDQAEYNQKIKNYHHYEFFRGEDFIENVPYPDDFKYSLKDKIAEEKEKERVSIEELQPMLNHYERAKLIRERITAYHEKQKKYELEQFQRYLSQYPGTVRGPRPEDDWEAYKAYALKKMPRILIDEINQQMADKRQREEYYKDNEEQEDGDNSTSKIETAGTLLSTFSKDRILLDPTNKEQEAAYMKEFNEGWQKQQIIQESRSEVPLMPSLNFENYQHFMNYWISWIQFRNSYIDHNLAANLKILGQRMEKLTNSFIEAQEDEWLTLPSNIPSLCRYYRCLPKELQDNQGLKDIYLGLEYMSPDFAYEEKEDALNRVCPLLLPFDDISTKVMNDYIAKSRMSPTIYMHQKVFTISPEFTWDMNSFLDEIRKQQLRGQTSNQDKQAMYPEPPEVHLMWEEGAPNLPVDYYDNEDGFWDSVISQKLKRYDEYKPMLKTRRYFTH